MRPARQDSRWLATLWATLLLAGAVPTDAQQPGAARSPCPRAIRVNTNHQYRGQLHFVCLQANGNLRPRLEVIEYASGRLVVSQEVNEPGTNQLASFVDPEGSLRILVAVPDRLNGTSMYSVDAAGQLLDETHTINTQHVSAMAVWRLDLNREWQLAIANQPDYGKMLATNWPPLTEPRPMITFHSWRSSYFDSYQLSEFEPDARINKLEPMRIGDLEFLVVAMESRRTHHAMPPARHNPYLPAPAAVHSQIFRLDFGDGNLNWLLYQTLGTRLMLDVSSFVIKHRGSLQVDYFVAAIGQLDVGDNRHQLARPNATEAAAHGLIIYKFLGDHFVQVLHLAAPTATKLDTISYGQGDSYVVLALLSEWTHQVNMYIFDGLQLKPIAAPFARRPTAQPRGMLAPPVRNQYQRSMDAAPSLHLFLMPPSGQDESAKRALDSQAQPNLPTVAYSLASAADGAEVSSPHQSGDGAESLYQIPIDELIREEESEQHPRDSSHSKRNLANSGQELLAWCKATISAVLLDDFEATKDRLRALPRVNQNRPIELSGDLIIEDDLHVSNLMYVNKVMERVDMQLQPQLVEQPPPDYSHIFQQIQATHQEIDRVNRHVDTILVDDGSVQNIFTPLNFEEVLVECASPAFMNPRFQAAAYMSPQCPRVGEIRTTTLNERDISNIQRQALLTGRSMVIEKDVRFEHLVLHGSTKILGRLNGVPIQDIVFRRSPSMVTISGHKNFVGGFSSNAHLRVDLWDGYQVTRDNYLTSSGAQRIHSGLKFNQLILDPVQQFAGGKLLSSRVEVLNGLHLDHHLSQIAVANGDNNYDVPIQFDELVLNGDVQFTARTRLSSINVEDQWANTMYKHGHQNITYPMEFTGDVHVSYGGNIEVARLVNGLPLRAGDVVLADGNYTITNPVVFHQDVGANRLHLGKALNGIQIFPNHETQNLELAILYDGGTQLITGDKVINEIHLGGQTNIHGTINGNLNLSQLHELANNNGKPHHFSHIRLSAPEIRVAENIPITVSSTINGIPANDLCSLALSVSQAPGRQYNRLRFEQPVTFKSLRCASINGFNNLTNYFLTRHGDQRVAGNLRLVNGAIFNTSLTIGRQMNGLDITPLPRAVATAINESRTGHRDVYGDLHIDELNAEQINGLRLSNVFLARSDSPQVVRAPMIFDHLDIENVLRLGNLVTGSFNGLNVTDILANTLQYDAPQVIYNHVQLNSLQLLPGANLNTKSLNGQDLRRLYADSVLVDAPQQILAPKTFRGQVDFRNRLHLMHNIDGLTEGDLSFNLLLQSDELIDGDLEFNNEVVVHKELEIQSGLINDIDINAFVDSMLHEGRANHKTLRVTNGSIRFKDVRVNNLVVAGTVQGLDLSREALLRADNANGTYDARIKEQQIMNNNQRVLNSLYGAGKPFEVRTNYRGQALSGSCRVHSCPRTTPMPATSQGPPIGVTNQWQLPPPPPHNQRPPIQTLGLLPPQLPLVHPNHVNHTQQLLPHFVERPPTFRYNQHLIPNVITRPIVSMLNPSQLPAAWRPNWSLVSNLTYIPEEQELQPPLDQRYLEYKNMLQAQAIRELAGRVNRYLSVSFYYEIAQKHPLLGPPLHAARNPNPNPGDESSALLLLRATDKLGEPCLQRGQTVAVLTQQRQRHRLAAFSQSSRIQETSRPVKVESLVVGRNNYLFVLDASAESPAGEGLASQVLVYLWDFQSGMYELADRIPVRGLPTAMRAFEGHNQSGCLVLANPKVGYSNHSGLGAPTVHCQRNPAQSVRFDQLTQIPLSNVFDLDVLVTPAGVVVATLAQQDTEQIGDLALGLLDARTLRYQSVATRRTVKPLRVHLLRSSPLRLVVSEGITSNEGAQAITRLFALDLAPAIRFRESQVVRDNEFHDIQSATLAGLRAPLLFLRSAHSVSIYAPLNSDAGDNCDDRYSLVQRLPTKGANKLLVFEDGRGGHYLVLSRDNCDQQQFWTIILRAVILGRASNKLLVDA